MQKKEAKERNIIFLDVDGVLNNHTTKDRIHGYIGVDDNNVTALKKLVEMYDAEIVLVSDWKGEWYKDKKERQDEFANRLDEKLAMQGLSILDKTEDEGWNRGEGILNWLQKNGPVDNYIILDDNGFDYKEKHIAAHWVQSSYYAKPIGGFTERQLLYLQKHRQNYKTQKESIDLER